MRLLPPCLLLLEPVKRKMHVLQIKEWLLSIKIQEIDKSLILPNTVNPCKKSAGINVFMKNIVHFHEVKLRVLLEFGFY